MLTKSTLSHGLQTIVTAHDQVGRKRKAQNDHLNTLLAESALQLYRAKKNIYLKTLFRVNI